RWQCGGGAAARSGGAAGGRRGPPRAIMKSRLMFADAFRAGRIGQQVGHVGVGVLDARDVSNVTGTPLSTRRARSATLRPILYDHRSRPRGYRTGTLSGPAR